MAIPIGHHSNLATIIAAARNNDLCLMECRDAATGETVIALCAAHREGKEIVFSPLAKLFNGNPYEELTPPISEEVDNG